MITADHAVMSLSHRFAYVVCLLQPLSFAVFRVGSRLLDLDIGFLLALFGIGSTVSVGIIGVCLFGVISVRRRPGWVGPLLALFAGLVAEIAVGLLIRYA